MSGIYSKGIGELLFLNSTIANPGDVGIFFNSCVVHALDSTDVGNCQYEHLSYFYNNLIINPGIHYEEKNFWKDTSENYLDFITPEVRDAHTDHVPGNFLVEDISLLGLKNPAQGDFRIADNTSPLIDAGGNSFKVVRDHDDSERLQGDRVDAGALEYGYEITSLKTDRDNDPDVYFTSSSIFRGGDEVKYWDAYSADGKKIGASENREMALFADYRGMLFLKFRIRGQEKIKAYYKP